MSAPAPSPPPSSAAAEPPSRRDLDERKRRLSHERGVRFRARKAKNSEVRFDRQVGYDGVVLGEIVMRGYIAECDLADAQKLNDALTKLLLDAAHNPPPARCPRCLQVF